MKKILILLSLLFALSSNAFAQVVPEMREIKIEAKAQEELRGSFEIENSSNVDLNVTAYFEDVVYPSPFNGLKEFKSLGSTSHSIGKFITILPDNFILSANSKQKISYKLTLPQDAKGTSYGILFFQTGNSINGGTGLSVINRSGVTFIVNASVSVKSAEIMEIDMQGSLLRGSIKNIGNTLLISEGSFYIMDSNGVMVDRGTIAKVYLPAGEVVPMKIDFANLKEGKYLAVINFDLGDKPLVKEVNFTKDSAGITINKISD